MQRRVFLTTTLTGIVTLSGCSSSEPNTPSPTDTQSENQPIVRNISVADPTVVSHDSNIIGSGESTKTEYIATVKNTRSEKEIRTILYEDIGDSTEDTGNNGLRFITDDIRTIPSGSQETITFTQVGDNAVYDYRVTTQPYEFAVTIENLSTTQYVRIELLGGSGTVVIDEVTQSIPVGEEKTVTLLNDSQLQQGQFSIQVTAVDSTET